MSRLYFLLLAGLSGVLAVSLFWNYRLYHENRRVGKLLLERRGREAPPKRNDRATLQAKIKEEREAIDALTQRLNGAQAALDAADDLPRLEKELEKQRAMVADITRRWERLGGTRLSAAELAGTRKQLAAQIDVEERAIADLRVRRAKLAKSRVPASKPLLQAANTQLSDRLQLLAELRSQRAALARQRPRPPETRRARRQREQLQERLAAETENYEKMKSLYEQAKALSPKDREEMRQLADVVQFHQSTLRDLEHELTERGAK